MVSFSKQSLATLGFVASMLAMQSNAWLVQLWSSQNSCGGEGAADTERGGVGKQTTDCIGFGIIEVKAVNISDWDDGCNVEAYNNWDCTGTPLTVWDKANEEVVDNNWSCINNLAEDPDLANFQAIKYVCA